ncbi:MULTISPECIES: hypothetical protein [Pseudomonas]|nr:MULTISPECIES: hypothetical protein [Pseudomonas]MCU1723137.1 hypothetical protein [Pseudomonas sp. 5P_5.1_Bac1]MCU1734598.1 hypothetical protein [Pseudomonas sp. 20P_3.2_Bac4]MCU1747495.1 hypothetical protein [Pseudomonas sp. 20P_3.2_Bac5]
MSQTLILSMMEEGQIFDARKMREWLDGQRGRVPVPSIEVHEAILMP